MSVKIRLAKAGKRHQITYRVVAQDTRSKRDGKFLDVLGFYNPYNTPSLEINKEKVAFWTKNGAVATLAVKSLMSEGKLTKKVSRRKRKLAEEKAAQASNQPTPQAQTTPQTPEEAPEAQAEPEAETKKTEAPEKQEPEPKAIEPKAEEKQSETA